MVLVAYEVGIGLAESLERGAAGPWGGWVKYPLGFPEGRGSLFDTKLEGRPWGKRGWFFFAEKRGREGDQGGG